MQDLIINNSLNFIKKNNPDIDREKEEIIKYGLVSIYLVISKLLIILLLCYILGTVKEMLIFSLTYNLIRMPSFGLHATKSWICLIVSIIMFIGIPFICLHIFVPNIIKIIIGTILTLFILKNSPADTHKRPIINPKRRKVLKIISTFVSIIFVVLSILIKDNFISNCLIASIASQTLFISPTIYKIFKLPYNNYKNYSL